MSKNTSVALGEHFENFIAYKIRTGRYASASEVIRAGLRLLEEEENQMDYIREALEQGEKSGVVEDFDPQEYLSYLHKRRQ